MNISDNTAAQVSYKIQKDNRNGELIEFAEESSPRTLIFGNQRMMPGIEEKLMGLTDGDAFEFALEPEQSFGTYREDMVLNVPKSAFMVNGELKSDLLYLGNEISMRDQQGNPVSGRVMEILEDAVRMDFNHTLAGSGLYMSGKIHHVRELTEDDLAPKGCGSGCGCSSEESTGGSCCSSHNDDHEHEYEDDCPSCGNPAHLRGKGHGDCGCA